MTKSEQIKSGEEVLSWGIIGCGDVVKRKSGPALLKAERSKIKAVMRRDASKAEEYASEHGIPRATDEPEELFEDPAIDVIYVATPPSSHKDYAIAGARAGKDVVIEKPMGLNSSEAGEMIEVCKEENAELFVAYYRRFYPHVKKIKELIEAGEIGDPVQSHVYISFEPPEDAGWREEFEISGGGWFVDVASHRLDLLAYLLGKVEQAWGVITSFESGNELEDTVTMSLKFDSGTQASIQGDFYTHHSVDKLYVHGTEGTIYTDDLSQPQVFLKSQGNRDSFQFERFPATHSGLVEHVEKVLLDGEQNKSSGLDGLITEEVLDEVLRS